MISVVSVRHLGSKGSVLAIESLKHGWKNIKHKTVRQTQIWERYTYFVT